MGGDAQLGKNVNEFGVGSGLYARTQFANSIFNTASGRHRTTARRGGTFKMAEIPEICDTGCCVGRIGEVLNLWSVRP